MKSSLLLTSRRLFLSPQRFKFSQGVSSVSVTQEPPINSWTKYSRTNIDVHEAGHAAYSLSTPSYLPFEYARVYAPDSKKFRAGIYGVTCYNPDKALALPIRKGNEHFIKFSLVGKIAEKIIGSEVQHGIENNASGDILSV